MYRITKKTIYIGMYFGIGSINFLGISGLDEYKDNNITELEKEYFSDSHNDI